jgi:membrane fusion protein, adhesin transport system
MARKKKYRDSLGKTLTLPLGLRNDKKVRFLRSLTYICCGVVIGTTAWSAVAEFREVAVAHGQIVPTNATQKVHHLEGGILEEVMVAEGQEVAKGQPLVRLRPEGVQDDLQQLEAHLASLGMQHIRLQALATGRQPDFGPFGNSYPDIRREQLDLYSTTINKDASEREKLQLEIRQAETELSTMREERRGLLRQIDIETEQVGIRQKTFDQGHTSRIAFLEAKARLESMQSKLASTDGKISQLASKVEETRHALEKTENERIQKLADERSKVTGEIFEKRNALNKYRDRVARLTVRSPENGIVQLLVQRTPGEVIKPGDLVAEVVSLDADMLAEVRLAVKDIGHVKLGDPANIKVSNYDPTGMEIATGRVVGISATTLETKEGQPYYRTRIKLDSPYIGPPSRNWRLLPGMVVETDIVTGSKSLMRYMLKPVYRSLNSAFSER